MSRYIVSRLLLISAFGACAWAQVQSGRITGTVFDPNKAVIPNASVTVTETATNVARQTTTNGSGAYVVPALNPGIYTISVTAPGFGATVRSGIEMQVGKDLLLDVDLTIGETNTTVQVTEEVPLLNSESGNLGHVMTNRQIVDLPLNGRGFSDLARLTPGVVLPARNWKRHPHPSGSRERHDDQRRSRTADFLLSRRSRYQRAASGGSWIQTSIDALQEFSVQQNAYSAEHSRSGSFFNATTKSGTNRVHGTAIRVSAKRQTRFPQLLRCPKSETEAQPVRRCHWRPGRVAQDLQREQPYVLLL